MQLTIFSIVASVCIVLAFISFIVDAVFSGGILSAISYYVGIASVVIGAIAFVLTAFGFVGILVTRNYEGTGERYACIQIDGDQYYTVDGKDIQVLYKDGDEAIQCLDISKSKKRMPLAVDETPYVEVVDWKFLFYKYRDEVCHIEIR